MKAIASIALMTALALAPLAAGAGEPVHAIIESSIETTGAGAHLPDSLTGRIDLIDCGACVDRSLQLQPDTRFTVNGAPVTFAQLRNAAAGASDKALTIHYTLADRLVTRVDLVSF
jgi:hypothetical protein